jgi:parallel beta-helix repeat protein
MPLEAVNLSTGAGGGAAFATVTVAASDATADQIAAADFICDGVADEVQINAAMAALPSVGGFHNGQILFLGNFLRLSNSADLSALTTSTIVWRGMGAATYYSGDAVTTIVCSADHPTVVIGSKHLEIYNLNLVRDTAGTAAVVTVGSSGSLKARDSSISGDGRGRGIDANTGGSGSIGLDIVDCYLDALQACISVTGHAYNSYIRNNYLYSGAGGGGSEYCVEIDEGASSPVAVGYEQPIFICDNFSDGNDLGAIRVKNAGNVVVDGNWVYYDDVETIVLQNVTLAQVTNNQVGDGYGIKLDTCTHSEVSGNTVSLATHHGIWMLDCTDCSVVNNEVAGASVGTDNTYSGIIIDGNSDRNLVQGNRIRHAGQTNKPLYGIRIDDSTCDKNIVGANSLVNSTKTSGNEFSDAGTGTVIPAAKTLTFAQAGTLITGAGVGRARVEADSLFLGAEAMVNTAPTGASILVDANKNGATIYTTQASRVAIAASANSGAQAGAPDVKTASAGDYITVDIDQIGSTIAGADLTVFVRLLSL